MMINKTQKPIHYKLTTLKRGQILLIIVLFGLFVRIFSIHVPLLDLNPWRQTEAASIARNFYENRFNIFYPQVNWGGASSGYTETGFPIYTFLVAILYKIFGFNDWLGRLVSLFFFIFSTIFLFKLVEKIYDEKTAIWAALFFTIAPLSIQFSRAFMPTSLLVCCSVASIYYFSEWMDTESIYSFLAAATATALAVLIKIPSLYLGLPLLYLSIKKYKKTVFIQWRMWLFAVFVLLPAVAWYYHAYQLFLQTHITAGILGGGYVKLGGLKYWLNVAFYRTIAFRLINDILTLPGMVFASIGFFLKVEKKNYVTFWWALAFGIYIIIASEGHQTHFHYQMPLVPIVCIYAGQGTNYLWTKDLFKDSFLRGHLSTKSTLIILFIIISIVSTLRTRHYLRFNPDRLAFGKRIEQLTEKGDLIIVGGWNKGPHLNVKYPPRDPIDFYFSHRKGWEINLDDWSLSLVENLRQKGARYFVTFYPMGFERKKTFSEEMKIKYKILEATDRWVIYALDK